MAPVGRTRVHFNTLERAKTLTHGFAGVWTREYDHA
jgi:hypothetical protein